MTVATAAVNLTPALRLERPPPQERSLFKSNLCADVPPVPVGLR
jgi:hypothetical protein